MSRRRFLGIALSFLALVTAGAAGLWLRARRVASPVRLDPFARGIREKLSYLRIDDDLLARFAQDYRIAFPGRSVERTPSAGDLRRFLLSTDFFQHGADESRRLRYVAFYDPYVTPCYQPLAHS